MNAYVDTKDKFDKYFEMGTILTIFFNQWIILDLNSNFGIKTTKQDFSSFSSLKQRVHVKALDS